jgi:hypothetical protein
MIIVIITMIGHACESRGDQGINNGEGERKDTEDWIVSKYATYIYVCIYIYKYIYASTYIQKQHNETHQTLIKGGCNRERIEIKWRGLLIQGTLCTCMELSQWNPLILLMHSN